MNSAKLVELVGQERADDASVPLDYGNLVTITGKLICLDQALIGNLLKSPSVVDQIAGGIESDLAQRSSKVQQKEKKDLAATMREFLNSLPLGIVFTLFTKSDAFWFNVKREYLQLQALDIPLKFPVQIGGTWHVTGVVDALPQEYGGFGEELGSFGDKLVFSQAFSILTQLVIPLVGMFGRPSDAYGLSPVTIHREISL